MASKRFQKEKTLKATIFMTFIYCQSLASCLTRSGSFSSHSWRRWNLNEDWQCILKLHILEPPNKQNYLIIGLSLSISEWHFITFHPSGSYSNLRKRSLKWQYSKTKWFHSTLIHPLPEWKFESSISISRVDCWLEQQTCIFCNKWSKLPSIFTIFNY